MTDRQPDNTALLVRETDVAGGVKADTRYKTNEVHR